MNSSLSRKDYPGVLVDDVCSRVRMLIGDTAILKDRDAPGKQPEVSAEKFLSRLQTNI